MSRKYLRVKNMKQYSNLGNLFLTYIAMHFVVIFLMCNRNLHTVDQFAFWGGDGCERKRKQMYHSSSKNLLHQLTVIAVVVPCSQITADKLFLFVRKQTMNNLYPYVILKICMWLVQLNYLGCSNFGLMQLFLV